MPEPQLPFFQFPVPTLRHLLVPTPPRSVVAAPGSPNPPRFNPVERRQHAESLASQIRAIEGEISIREGEQIEQGLPQRVDLVLDLESAPGFPLSADHIHALTTGGSRIALLYARNEQRGNQQVTRVLLHVPYGSLPSLAEKVRQFGEEATRQGNTPYRWVANLQQISRATLAALWTDAEAIPVSGDTQHWWQLWLRRFPPENVAEFDRAAIAAGVEVKPFRLTLPDHIVVIAGASRDQLEASLDLLNTLAEVRSARLCHYELSDLPGVEQHEWIAEALTRMTFPDENAPAVCVLDSGVNRGHPLLSPLLAQADNHTVFGDADSSDSHYGTGHGTLMAGLAAYTDLRKLTLSSQPWIQYHRLEGVKVFDRSRPHDPENYGAICVQGVLLPETVAPRRRRVYALSITAAGDQDGRPSAWSAALDSVAFGAEEEGEPKRLLLVSAGNIDPTGVGPGYQYPGQNLESPVQDPAQAWNVVTVGAVTHRGQVLEADPESQLLAPVAAVGQLSPFSTTSIQWARHWPIKPEIVMEGGNLGRHPQNGPEQRDSLDLLSTAASFRIRPIASINATSAATGLAAHLAAGTQALYPDLRPETIRGILVHSARWNARMLDGLDPYSAFNKAQRQQLIRLLQTYGFGEPAETRARFSSEQEVTLLYEGELTPYKKQNGAVSLNDCHVHALTVPTQLLRGLGDTTCTMRVTLSYFVAPNPSSSNRIPGSRYRYGGALLRFRVRHKDEAETDFLQHVSSTADEESDEDEAARSMHDRAWALGQQLRGRAGSLVQDIWRGNAADLASMTSIAVYPTKGWWAFRSFPAGSPWHRCYQRSLRYSLIVSLEVEADVPLYTEISNLLSVPVDAT